MADHHEGQRVSRRRLVAGITSIGLGSLLAACGKDSTSGGTTPQASTTADLTSLFAGVGSCTLTPTVTQGPYYFDADKIRSDIREDRTGTRLRVAIKVQDSEECKPLGNAVVEIWHCDADGVYSGAEARSTGGGGENGGAPGGTPPSGGPGGGAMPSGMPTAMPSGMPTGAPPSGASGGGAPGGGDQSMQDLTPTDDKRYLRGAQVTNAEGIVEFTTVWPGWYRGRTVHIHAMVHVNNSRVLTSQIMFDEALNTEVYANAPYSSHTGRDTFNTTDSIFQQTMLAKVTRDGDGYVCATVLSADSDRDGA